MNSILEEILKSQSVKTSDGVAQELTSNISPEEGEFLQALIRKTKAKITLEVGLAYGISALYICEANQNISSSQHIMIDPNQSTQWKNIGMSNLKKAGFEKKVKLYEQPSHLALPRLEAEGLKIDFAFIDGWHTFDYTLVDFFHIDRILKVGGIIAIDDSNFSGVKKVCSYILNNRSYRLYEYLKQQTKISPYLKGMFSTALNISPRFLYDFLKTGIANLVPYARCIALIKENDDMRRYDFHHEF